jgi:hypothetical protein
VSPIRTTSRSSRSSATAGAIRDAIGKVSHAVPGDEDIARVRARLAAGGRPLAPLHSVRPGGPGTG